MGYLTQDPIDARKRHQGLSDPRDGACVEFLGIVRANEGNRPIEALEYEAHAPMAEAVIGRLIEEAKELWPLHRVEVSHRIGRVPTGEIAVLIRVEAPHRDQAFAACRFLMDRIKQEAPIWKRAWAHGKGQLTTHRAED